MAFLSCPLSPTVMFASPLPCKADARFFRQNHIHKRFLGTPIITTIAGQGTFLQGARRSPAAAGQARAGLPVISSVPVLGPLVNTLLSPLVLLAVYALGAIRFFSGFSNTTYTDLFSTKLGLTLAWPVLFVVSQKYRSNFKKAVR